MRFLAILSLLLISTFAYGDADGPDCFEVRGVKKNDTLALRAKPEAKSEKLADIPFNAHGLKNLFEQSPSVSEGQLLSMSAKEQKKYGDTVWNKIEYQKKAGWVKGSYIGEGRCEGE